MPRRFRFYRPVLVSTLSAVFLASGTLIPAPGRCQTAPVALVREVALPPTGPPWIEFLDFRGKRAKVNWPTGAVEYPQVRQTSTATSLDLQHHAIAARRDGGSWMLVVDGRELGPFEDVISPVFSPDGRRLAYYAKRNGKWRAVVDGVEQPAFAGKPDEWGGSTLWFSPDSRRFAYVAVTRKLEGQLVVDGATWPQVCLDWQHGYVHFSADSRRVAVLCPPPGYFKQLSVLLDGREIGRFDEVSAILFHPKTSEPVVIGLSSDRPMLVGLGLDEVMEPGRRFTRTVTPQGTFGASLYGLNFSADGEHFGYAISDDTQLDLYVDGRSVYYRKGGTDGSYGALSVVMSANGRRMAAMVPGRVSRIVDLELGPDPSTTRWVALAVREHAAREGELRLSPSGRHLAYVARQAHLKWTEDWVVLDGQEGPHYLHVDPNSLAWETDGALSYLVNKLPGTVWTPDHRVTQNPPDAEAWTPSP